MSVVVDEFLFVEELCGNLVEELVVRSAKTKLLDGRVLCTQSKHCGNILANLLAVFELTENACSLFFYHIVCNNYVAVVFEVQSGWCFIFGRDIPLVVNLPVNTKNDGYTETCLVTVEVYAVVVECLCVVNFASRSLKAIGDSGSDGTVVVGSCIYSTNTNISCYVVGKFVCSTEL